MLGRNVMVRLSFLCLVLSVPSAAVRSTSVPADDAPAASCFCDYFMDSKQIPVFAALGLLERISPETLRLTVVQSFGTGAPPIGSFVDMPGNTFVSGYGQQGFVLAHSSGGFYVRGFEAGITLIGNPEDSWNGQPRTEYCRTEVAVPELLAFLDARGFLHASCERDIYAEFGLPLPRWLQERTDTGCAAGANAVSCAVTMLFGAFVWWRWATIRRRATRSSPTSTS